MTKGDQKILSIVCSGLIQMDTLMRVNGQRS